MLRFIFGKKNNTPTVKTETQRESFERVMTEKQKKRLNGFRLENRHWLRLSLRNSSIELRRWGLNDIRPFFV